MTCYPDDDTPTGGAIPWLFIGCILGAFVLSVVVRDVCGKR
jgi:hypothetical protein